MSTLIKEGLVEAAEIQKLMELLRSHTAGEMSEVAHVTTFKATRKAKSRGMQEITVEVGDHGPQAPSGTRYRVTATDTHGRVATGNSDDNLIAATLGVHWNDLDKEPDDPGVSLFHPENLS
jgi:hypothetical protein